MLDAGVVPGVRSPCAPDGGMISFSCPSCGYAMSAAPSYAGTRGPCPGCKTVVQVPSVAGGEHAPTVATPPPTKPGSSERRAGTSERRAATSERRSAVSDPALADEIDRARADPGKRFGRFLLLSELGRGGMGVVHRAWDESLRRVVAVKTLLTGDQATDEAIKRFHREAEAVARLRHPGIVSVHETGQRDGRHFLAMDYVAGKTLDRFLQEKLPLTKGLEIVRDVARAVEHAHSQGVVHRDLKPQNVIVDENGRAHVLDFGLALLREGEASRITRTGAMLGTPAYMPPEQCSGEDERADERSDVYSLGATLYHVLCGQPPFAGEALKVVTSVLTKDPVPPGSINPRAKGDLETICLKCLEKEPSERYASAEDLATDLDRYLAGEPIAARPIGSVARAWRWARRNRALAAGLVLAVGGVVAGAGMAVASSAAARAREIADGEAEARRALRTFADGRGEPPWELARRAFERAGNAEGVKEVDEARTRAAREHRDAVTAVLQAARAGDLASYGGPSGAVLELVRYPEPQTVELLAQALDEITAKLRKTRREVCLEVGVERTAEALDALEKIEPGVALGSPHSSVLVRVAQELLAREEREKRSARGRGSDARVRTGFREIVGDRQGEALGAAGIDLARISCEALGAIRLEEAAIPALLRYVFAEEDELRAREAGIALSRIGTERAQAAALLGRNRFGLDSNFWRQVTPSLGKSKGPDSVRGPSTAEDCYARAIEHEERGEHDAAILDYTKAIELDPRRASAWHGRGVARRAKGDLEGAISDSTKAIELDPRDARSWNNRANARQDKGDLEGAISDFGKAIELDPQLAAAWSNRGDASRAKGDLEGAISDSTQAIALDPRLVHAWINRGLARQAKGDLEGAVSDLDKAIEVDPRYAHAWNDRGLVRQAKGDLESAISDFDKAIELDARYGLAWYDRANARKAKGDLEGAISDYTRTIELLPREPGAWDARGLARQGKGDLEGAISDYDRAIELDRRYAHAWNGRGLVRQAKGDLEGSIADFDRSIELDPRNAGAWNNRGLVRHAKGDLDGAVSDFDKSIELDPRVALPWRNRGNARLAKGDLDGALSDYGKAIELDPAFVSAYGARAHVRLEKGDREGAAKDMRRLLELAPNDPRAPAVRAKLAEIEGSR